VKVARRFLINPRSLKLYGVEKLGQMSLARPLSDESDQIALAGQKFLLRKPSSEKFVAKPKPIRIGDIRLAIFRDVSQPPCSKQFLNAPTVNVPGFPWQTERAADFMQRCLCVRTERCQYVTEIDGVFRIAVEVVASGKAGCRNSVQHDSIP
jgi:hypothetical protein